MEDLLWDYIDNRLTPAERAEVETLLASDAALREQYAELLEVHATIAESGIDEPSLRFTKNVMEAIADQSIAPATPTYVNKKIIRGITIALLSLLGATFAYVLVLLKLTPSKDNNFKLDIPQVTIPAVHLDPYLSVFIFIALLSAFFWIDTLRQRKRAVKNSLRP